MLVFVGLGLSPAHLTEEAKKHLKNADIVYMDVYTVQGSEIWKEELLRFNKNVRISSRKDLEDGMKEIVQEAVKKNVVIAVPGDPFAATTHKAIWLEALKRGVKAVYVPGISIISVAPSLSGLDHYRFGLIITMPKRWRETPSFYEKIYFNRNNGLHTLLLLEDDLSIPEALKGLLEMEKRKRRGVIELSDLVIGIARAGMDDCKRVVGTVEELMNEEWPPPPHTMIIPSPNTFEEELLYELYRNRECTGKIH